MREKADTIGWYEQHIAFEHDPQAKAVIREAQQEECKHLAMTLEFVSKPKAVWPFSWTWLENLELEAQLGRVCWSQ